MRMQSWTWERSAGRMMAGMCWLVAKVVRSAACNSAGAVRTCSEPTTERHSCSAGSLTGITTILCRYRRSEIKSAPEAALQAFLALRNLADLGRLTADYARGSQIALQFRDPGAVLGIGMPGIELQHLHMAALV